MISSFSIDVEDWFHILDSPQTPPLDTWGELESRVSRNVETLLELLEQKGVTATFFWLGWIAEQNPKLLEACVSAGHEIASHGYAHELPYEIGPDLFRQDLIRSKGTLEDLSGLAVRGYRAPGFGITDSEPWAFEIIRDAGYEYDSSVFPTSRGHGGLASAPHLPYVINTAAGSLVEIPISTIRVFRKRIAMFGGGYLRIAPLPMIRWGVKKLRRDGAPLVVYIHPREIDPDHPRLDLKFSRRFKSYVNLKSTKTKIDWMLSDTNFIPMGELADSYIRSHQRSSRTSQNG